MKTIKVTIKSISPMLMHSDVTANPLGFWSKELKKYTSKRKKTDEDHEAISSVEFQASCYYDEGKYVIPSANIEACMLASAKQFKLGTTIKQAVIVPEDATFDFEHSDLTPEKLYSKAQYVDMRTVKVGTSKTIRTRPIFHSWESTFEVFLDEDKMNPEQVIDIISNAGKYVGLGDYRPRYGRFEIKNWK